MPSPTAHALLSPSSAHRWLECTAAPLFEAQFPPTGDTKYTREGTLAHSVCELYARTHFQKLAKDEAYQREFNALVKDPAFSSEMLDTADAYVEYLTRVYNSFQTAPVVFFEQRVDLTRWVPDGFGSCDSIMIGDDRVHIVDYKHGAGVPVSAKGNPQMRLYALGALGMFRPIFGDAIKRVSMGICQPRLYDEASEDELTVEELLDWGENVVRVRAKAAYDGTGIFKPGDHCRFCRGKYQCRARANDSTALEDFKDCVTPDKAETQGNGEDLKRVLTNAEIGDLLTRGEHLVAWYNDLREYAQTALLQGDEIPGYKLVEGRSTRSIDDMDGLIDTLKQAGFDEAVLYERKPLTLTAYEKLVGKKRFGELVGDLITKPKGKPTLVTELDPRQPYSAAENDFAEIAK